MWCVFEREKIRVGQSGVLSEPRASDFSLSTSFHVGKVANAKALKLVVQKAVSYFLGYHMYHNDSLNHVHMTPMELRMHLRFLKLKGFTRSLGTFFQKALCKIA